jgi:hypothetical protein
VKAKGKKVQLPAVALPVEVSDGDRTMLTAAYKGGLILGWKRDTERGYCMTVAGRLDEYVELGQLAKYLDRLRSR